MGEARFCSRSSRRDLALKEQGVKFGVQFFPDVEPGAKPAADYFRECLDIGAEAERLGFTHGRIVEHYFHPYGGYSPNPLIFLSALAQRTQRLRLVTGAVLPVFNNPLKLAGEIAMVDAISGGRVDIGVARAFLLHEFRRFGISPDESVERFREGLEQIDLLLREENVSHAGKFHTISETTSLPRPTQTPRPKFYIAAVNTPESFEFAGHHGHSIMAIPLGGRAKELIGLYRDAWRKAGHSGRGEVMLAFHMYCERDGAAAYREAKPHIDHYFVSQVDAAKDWIEGAASSAYPGYAKMFERIKELNIDTQIESGSAWIGSPDDVRRAMIAAYDIFGEFEHASLQVNFGMLPFEKAMASMRLFASEVMRDAPAIAA
jgi:alkanesulfonate monooxygenase SsuD/methylene tetrahydromethanopterin reductase-like flavin-dependent oxidoreductase (luciferase family)